MPLQPDLPERPEGADDSMLTRKFGKEVTNYFAGSPLNRLGFLRSDHSFLSQALRHPSTNFLLCNELQPLVRTAKANQSQWPKLHWVKYNMIKGIVGEDPYAQTEDEIISAFDSAKQVPQIIFLGIDEKDKQGLSYQGKNLYSGAPYFAVDVTPKGTLATAASSLISAAQSEVGLEFAQGRVMDLEAPDAAIYAEARQLLDWNARNPFCAQCGHPTMSTNGGFKRTCPPRDASLRGKNVGTALPTNETTQSADPSERPPCATRKGVSNLSFPRTDPTVIMAIINSSSTAILLGRGKRFPPHWYSTLAGFCEPAESIEEAVRREVYEEAGVHVGRVIIHSTQPWPYPANLMVGAIGQTIAGKEEIDLGNDPELLDAQWYGFEEVREALRVGTSGLGESAGPEYKEGGLRLPPDTAIANQLMSSVVGGLVGGESKM